MTTLTDVEKPSMPVKAAAWRIRRLPLSPERGWLLPASLAGLLIVLIVLPLASVLTGSFRPQGLPSSAGWTLSHYIEIWSSDYIYKLLGNTVVFAFGSTVLATAIALALAWLIARTDIPGRDFFRTAILMPMVTPPLLLAIGWVLIMSPKIGLIPTALQPYVGSFEDGFNIYSVTGMIFVQALAYVPTAFLILTPMILNMDPTFEEAATMAGASSMQTFFRVSLPFLVPSLLSIGTLLIIVGMASFDVPAIIGTPGNVSVLSSEIFSLMTPASGPPLYGQSAAINASLFVPLLLGLALYQRMTRRAERFAAINGKGYKATRFALRGWKVPAVFLVGLYFILAVALPFIALLWVSMAPYFSGFSVNLLSDLSFAAYSHIFGSERVVASIKNSLVVALSASVVLVLLAMLVGWTIVRSRRRWVKMLDVLSMIPIGVSHLMTGVALVFVFLNLRGVIPIYGTVWIIALAHVIVYLPLAARMMQAAMMQINRELEEAAMVCGSSFAQNVRRITIPLLKPTIFALFIWVFVHSLREFSAAVMLQTNRNEVLPTILFGFWETGEPARAAAIAIVLMIALAAMVLIMGRMTRHTQRA
jgi:iron(III) transport system permease protein